MIFIHNDIVINLLRKALYQKEVVNITCYRELDTLAGTPTEAVSF
jgi:hypothetical protein